MIGKNRKPNPFVVLPGQRQQAPQMRFIMLEFRRNRRRIADILMQESVQRSTVEKAAFDFFRGDQLFKFGKIMVAGVAPVGNMPLPPLLLPDIGQILHLLQAARNENIAFLGIVHIRQMLERHPVKLEIPGVSQ
ncbi:hypothetical protein SDC9_107297 [bioreactor metagenome]|uniref:Uncharacterized protein n=1 Tax=bioreactor metagenome TaxID=1076179 RepID=A0A645B5W5_9ZZZZ